jgi:hypothetical protein
MKAVLLHRYRSAEELHSGDTGQPESGDNEVLAREGDERQSG